MAISHRLTAMAARAADRQARLAAALLAAGQTDPGPDATLRLRDGATLIFNEGDRPIVEWGSWGRQKSGGYLTCHSRVAGSQVVHRLHRLIAGRDSNAVVAFINGDVLDCRRANLVPEGRPIRLARPVLSTCEISLGNGLVARIDPDNFERFSGYAWQAGSAGKHRSSYAIRFEYRDGVRQMVHMHREVLGAPDGFLVDHINRDGLDNRRDNLRLCTVSQNSTNSYRPPSPSGYRGVRRVHNGKSWCATIRSDGRSRYLGSAPTAEEAARLYDDAARRLHGEFATLNFPDQERAA